MNPDIPCIFRFPQIFFLKMGDFFIFLNNLSDFTKFWEKKKKLILTIFNKLFVFTKITRHQIRGLINKHNTFYRVYRATGGGRNTRHVIRVHGGGCSSRDEETGCEYVTVSGPCDLCRMSGPCILQWNTCNIPTDYRHTLTTLHVWLLKYSNVQERLHSTKILTF